MKKTPYILMALFGSYFMCLYLFPVFAAKLGNKDVATIAFASFTNEVGIIARWPLDGGIPNYAVNIITNENSGTLTSGPIFDVNGRIRGSVFFDGVNDYIAIRAPQLNGTGVTNYFPWSITGWALTTNTVAQDIYSEGNSTNSDGTPFLRIVANRTAPGEFGISMRDNANNIVQINAVGTAITNGLWNSFMVTHPTASNWVLYMNGALLSTGTTTTLLGPTTLDVAAIGALRRNTVATFFKGKIDDIRIYSNILSLTDFQAITNVP